MPGLLIRRDGVVLEGGGRAGFLDPGDPSAPLAHLGDVARIEPGLTAATLLRVLLPWSGVLSEMGGLDLPAWERSLSRARLRDVAAPEPRGSGLAGLVISPEVSFLRSAGAEEVRIDWSTHGTDASAPGTRYAVPGHVAAWAGLPVSVTDVARPAGGRPALRVTPTFYDAIVLGFLSDISWDGSPEEAAAAEDEVVAMAREVLGDAWRGD